MSDSIFGYNLIKERISGYILQKHFSDFIQLFSSNALFFQFFRYNYFVEHIFIVALGFPGFRYKVILTWDMNP